MNKLSAFVLRFTAAFIVLILSVFISSAQNATIKGFVYEKETGEPAIFTNVYLQGTTMGVSTDINGYFSLAKVPAGNYTIVVSSIQYDTLYTPIDLQAGETVTKKLTVNKRSVNLKAVEISAEKQEMKTDVKMSVNKVTPREIKVMPAVGGEPDLAQYLQVLPGVIFTGDQGGQLYIRGGTPVMNKVLLDGMVVYNPFHSIGLFSVFDTDLISNADVYTGAFPAQYAGRVSSIMDITTRDGNKKRYTGRISASPFLAKATIEGPLVKSKNDDGGGASIMVSYKNSYLDKTSPVFYSYANEDEGGLPYSFQDIYGKVSLNGANGTKLNVFGFNFNDQVNYEGVNNFDWKSTGFGTKFVLVPGNSTTLLDGNFAFSNYKMEQQEADDKPRTSDINGFNLGLNFTNFIQNDELKYGLEVLGYRTDFRFYNIAGYKYEQTENTTEFGFFLNYKKVWPKVVLNPGIRLHYYASLSEFSPEPRIGVKYNMTEKIRLKGAAGLFAQNLLSATSDRDVVNLFYGFLSAPENLPEQFKGETVTSRLQKAAHLVIGAEVDLPWHLDLNVEAYVKKFSQLINVNRDKIYDDTAENSKKPDELKKDYIIEDGIAKGIDITLKHAVKRIYVWVVYSLSYVDRDNGKLIYMPSFDRRHNINLVASYTFGKKYDWEVNSRWNFGSGFPFTPTQGFYPDLDLSGGIYADPTTENGNLGIIYGDYNSHRLPYYHRLDLSVKKIFKLGEHNILETTFSVTNVYDRQNIFYFNRVTYTRVNQLPILPSLNVSWTF